MLVIEVHAVLRLINSTAAYGSLSAFCRHEKVKGNQCRISAAIIRHQ